MNWRELCLMFKMAGSDNARRRKLAEGFRLWGDMYGGSNIDFERVVYFIADALDVPEEEHIRVREVRKGWRIIDNVARREVEQDLHKAGIIEDPDLDGGLDG